MGRVFPSTSGGDPIDSVAPFNKTEDLPEFSDGTTWLKTGVIETDIDSYPDAKKTLDISTGEYGGKSLDVNSENVNARDIAVSPDGTKAYTLSGVRIVFQYELSTPFDISTGTYDSKELSVNAQDSTMNGLAFSYDGSKMYTVGQQYDRVYQYDLTTPWDVSTGTYETLFYVGSQDPMPESVAFSKDGKIMYVTGSQNDRVYQYDLSTPFDISTAVYDTMLSVSAETSTPDGIGISEDGRKVLILGNAGSTVYQYDLSTPFDISTGTYSTKSLSVASELTLPLGISLGYNVDIYLINISDIIYQYDTLSHVGISTESTDTDTGLPIYTRIK